MDRTLVMKKDNCHVLIIDDESDFLDAVGEELETHFTVHKVQDALKALDVANEIKPQVVLLDINLPYVNGFEICRALRKNREFNKSKILVTSAQDNTDRRVQAFDSGADDFLPKPFSSKELIARIFSFVKRREMTDENDIIICGNISMNLPKMEVIINHKLVPLSLLEFNLLKFFVTNREIVLSREAILKEVWADAVVTCRTVDTHVVSLRKKIKDANYGFHTIYGAGYIFKSLEENS